MEKESDTTHAHGRVRTQAARAVTRQCYHQTKDPNHLSWLVIIPIYLTPSHYQMSWAADLKEGGGTPLGFVEYKKMNQVI
jgi:hypothetical protein